MNHKFLSAILLVAMVLFFGCKSMPERPRDSDLAGKYYRVKPGDTMSVIARKYQVSVEEIMDINGIEHERALRVGQALFLPDPDPIGKTIARLKPKSTPAKKAKKPATPSKKSVVAANKKIFDFPVPGGTIFQNYSKTKNSPYDGIGIKAPRGAKVVSSLEGRVLFVGDDGTKFGLLVIVEHKEPFITVYTHLDSAPVKAGQTLKRGELLGSVGQSGGVAIPHLHFQVRVDQRPQDPKQYLRALR